MDNTLLDLLNSSYPTKAEFINCEILIMIMIMIINYETKMFFVVFVFFRRIPSSGVNYTADQVHLLPGYPSGNLPGFLKVAFYVQQPPGLSIGNSSVLPRDTLLDIVLTYKSELERAIGINISDVDFWYKPSTTPGISPSSPVNTDSNVWKWIVIGVGAFLMLVLFGVLFKW